MSRADDILSAVGVSRRGQNTLAVGSAVRRMGLKGGALPILQEATWAQVVVMGQLNHLTSEPFEGRGLVCGEFSAGGAQFAGFEIFSRAAGGLVIENFVGDSPGGLLMRVRVSDTAAMSSGAIVPIDVGGIPVVSTCQEGGPFIAPVDGLLLALAASGDILKRLFIPPGSFFSLISTTTNQTLRWSVVFREMEDVQGAP